MARRPFVPESAGGAIGAERMTRAERMQNVVRRSRSVANGEFLGGGVLHHRRAGRSAPGQIIGLPQQTRVRARQGAVVSVVRGLGLGGRLPFTANAGGPVKALHPVMRRLGTTVPALASRGGRLAPMALAVIASPQPTTAPTNQSSGAIVDCVDGPTATLPVSAAPPW